MRLGADQAPRALSTIAPYARFLNSIRVWTRDDGPCVIRIATKCSAGSMVKKVP